MQVQIVGDKVDNGRKRQLDCPAAGVFIMHLRKASKKYLEAASLLFAELLEYELRFEQKDIPLELKKIKKRFLTEKDYVCFLVFDNKKPVAFADAHKEDIFGIGENAGYVRNIYIVKEYRHRGIGRVLLTKILQWITAQGKTKAVLDIYSKNNAARKAWKALGFHVTKTHGRFTRMEKLL